MDVGAIADQHAFEGRAAGPCIGDQRLRRQRFPRRDARPGSCQRLGQALRAERLQQVVDRVHLKGLDRVLVVGGDEDHRCLAADQLENVEAIEFRHLDVEEEQIGLLFGDGLHRLEAVAALGNHLDIGMLPEQLSQQRPRQLLIVHDDHPQRHFRRRHQAVASLTTGIRTSTRKCPDCSCA